MRTEERGTVRKPDPGERSPRIVSGSKANNRIVDWMEISLEVIRAVRSVWPDCKPKSILRAQEVLE